MNHIGQHREYAASLKAQSGAPESEKEPVLCCKCSLRLATKKDEDYKEVCELCALGKTKPIVRQGRRIGRNEQCPCGSGKKFKACHLALSRR